MSFIENVKDGFAVLKAAQSRDLHEDLVSKTREIGELTREVAQLRAEVERLTASMAFGATMRFRDNLYYATAEDGSEDGPFCSRCWDAEKLALRVHSLSTDGVRCPACKTIVTSSAQAAARRRTIHPGYGS